MHIFIITASLVIIADQATKFIIRANMKLYDSIPVIKNFFSITYIENSGISFGMLGTGNSEVIRYVLIGVIFIAMCAITAYWYTYRNKSFWYNLACGLILGGALGNFIDRVFIGRITDFLEVGYKNLTWPVFNVADSGVTVGVTVFIIYILFTKEEVSNKSHENGEQQQV